MTTPRPAAIVTGASSGTGRATALHLAERGRLVVVVGRRAANLATPKEQIRASGGAVITVTADLSKLRDIERAARARLHRH